MRFLFAKLLNCWSACKSIGGESIKNVHSSEIIIMPENPDSPVTSKRDGGLVVHPTVADSTGESSIRIPQADTSLGAGFADYQLLGFKEIIDIVELCK